MCVCVCVCVRARARVGACACACIYILFFSRNTGEYVWFVVAVVAAAVVVGVVL